ncbi:MAG: phosphoribosylformylglycinamidine cyclo-ligase, partial [Saprospiraceae bacterium]|nr:phosphoribosylformylglycinamidine cyclo-ligase [Saprospiraceae bacterium]
GTPWKEMFQVFNMGHRMELYIPGALATEIIELVGSFEIKAQIVGEVKNASQTRVTIDSEMGHFDYQ